MKAEPQETEAQTVNEVPFIGHLSTPTGVTPDPSPDPEKVRAIQVMPIPDGQTSAELAMKVKAV